MKTDKRNEYFDHDTIKRLLGLKGKFGDMATSFVMGALEIKKCNRILRPVGNLKGVQAAKASLKCVDVEAVTDERELLNIPATGPFIVCCNHPYGCIDGFMMMDVIGSIRPDMKIMTNFIISSIKPIEDLQIAVNPFPGQSSRSAGGIIKALEHLREGHPLVIFPAGEVSSNRNKEHVVKDVKWNKSAIKLIRKAGVPVIPAFFEGSNSRTFHALGAIHPILRTIRLPHELINKRGARVNLRFGKAITPAEMSAYSDDDYLGAYLWNRTYALEIKLQESHEHISEEKFNPIEPHIAPDILQKELAGLQDDIIFQGGGYVCYLSKYESIPNIMKEIGICREETFRINGEGTGKAVDIDEFDSYYLHLHLWNSENGEFVGAYRLGMGKEILKERGIKGFYSDIYFHFKEQMAPTLDNSIELGRSFIVEKYQAVPSALKTLLTEGLYSVAKKYKEYKHFIGAASISSDIPRPIASLMVEYFKLHMLDNELCDFIVPDIPFKSDFLRLDPASLRLDQLNIDRMDKLIRSLSDGKYRMPPLIRVYAKENARFIGFNIDPGFNDCIDSLVIEDFKTQAVELL